LIAEIIASDRSRNLTGERKAAVLVERFGHNGYDYVGNAETDRAIWRHADRKYIATIRPAGVPRWAKAEDYSGVLRDARPSAPRVWGRALRVHQSMKNVLVFLPLLAAHHFTNPALVVRSIGAFLAFSLMAFAVYLLNDTLDLAADRAHPRKRRRPLAAGWISPGAALSVGVVLTLVAVALGIALGTTFLVVLIGYAVLTTSYSFWLKRIALVDIVVLALLYMVRIIAGAAATAIPLSFWFTAVTLFLFLSLALVKRYAEAHHARAGARQLRGRGYSGDDVHAILALGTSAGVAAVLVAAIYIQSDAVVRLYPAPQLLWAVIPLLFYWVGNLWLKAGRGQMHDDPLVFALRDRASLIAASLIALVFVAASIPAFDSLISIGTLR
jgi:4-hydroxybenzoate polyprenyltransferase